MKTALIKFRYIRIVLFFGVTMCCARAATLYVSPTSPKNGPGRNWGNAFHVIQDAVDDANDYDTVIVGDGIYDTGGATFQTMSNRVAVSKQISLISANGPAVTFIVGSGPTGPSAVRCVYLSSGASLIGFSLTNGHTRTEGDYTYEQSGGGLLIEGGMVSNCIISANHAVFGGGINLDAGGMIMDCVIEKNEAANVGGGGYIDYSGKIIDCDLRGNAAAHAGGGVFAHWGGTVTHSVFFGNRASYGGAVNSFSNGLFVACMLDSNFSSLDGGAVYVDFSGEFDDCTFRENVAGRYGGAVFLYEGGVFNRSSVISNTAEYAGGINCYNGGVLNNLIMVGNYAVSNAGAVYLDYDGMLNFCTLTENGAGVEYGGVYAEYGGQFNNCIVWGNDAGNAFVGAGSWSNNCTSPEQGIDCISSDPLFFEGYRLMPDSPCIDEGVAVLGVSSDYEGIARSLDGDHDGAAFPDIGAFEFSGEFSDTDGDGFSDYDEYVAMTDAEDPLDYFRIGHEGYALISTFSSAERIYTLQYCSDLISAEWMDVEGMSDVEGDGQKLLFDGGLEYSTRFFRMVVEMP